jgi:hypothetical protein
VKAIEADFTGNWGDRRQELVFIGEKIDITAVTEAFDECLLTAPEMRRWERTMSNTKYTEEEIEDKLCMMFEGKRSAIFNMQCGR